MEPKVVFLLVYILFSISSLNTAEKLDDMDYNMQVFNEYTEIDKQLKTLANRGVKLLLPYMMEAREHINISARCTSNLFQLLSGLKKLTDWSVRFLDATGKLQSGLIAGNIQMLGDADECMDTRVLKKDGGLEFRGQFCSLKSIPHLPKLKKDPTAYSKIDGLEEATRNVSIALKIFTSRLHYLYHAALKIGVCVPSGCNEQDVTNIVQYVFEQIYMNTTVEYCIEDGDIYFWTKTRTVIVCIFVFLGIVIATSTFLDNFTSKYKEDNLSTSKRVLMCFSLTRNFPKLMSTKSADDSLTCFHGIRILGIFWVILGHEYLIHGFTLSPNHAFYFEKMLPRFFAQILFNSEIVVDTFFFISGFLNSYIRSKFKENGKAQPGILKIIIHRLWRIYPTLIVAQLTFYLFTKPGPFAYGILGEITEKCDRYWWRTFLFINNFFDFDDLCMHQTWFLSVEMQLFFMSLILVPVLIRSPRKGIILNLCMIFSGCFASVYWWWIKELPPHLDITLVTRKNMQGTLQAYLLPFQHFGPYFIGILMGFMITVKKDLKFSKILQTIGWIAASFCFVSMLFMTQTWNAGNKYGRAESILYGAFSRPIAILGFAWMVICCATGQGGIINYILSLKLWHPLAKISYMLYLVSPIVQIFYHSNLRFPFDASDITIIWSYLGSVFVSVLLCLVLVVIAESPIIALEKEMFRGAETDKKSPSVILNEIERTTKKVNDLNDNEKYVVIHL